MVVVFSMAASCCAAGVRLASPFTDGAVLQRGMKVPVWGWADPGEKVEVAFAGHSATAVAGADGRWKCTLPPMEACKEGRTLSVAVRGGNPDMPALTVKDVLVGEVWFVAGQSNCEFPICSDDPHLRDAHGGLTSHVTYKPLIRYVNNATKDYSASPAETTSRPVVWKKFVPENLSAPWSFSAIGVYFALELYSALEIPVGLIGAYWGATMIEPWIPHEGFAGDPLLAKEYAWKAMDAKDFAAAGGMVGKLSPAADGHDIPHQQPTVIWNRQVAPFAPYAMRGMIWYQGCSNSKDSDRYCNMMHALYRGWSMAFGNPDFKLYFVQLANYGYANWNDLWVQQAKFEREEPNSAMALANDVGNVSDIHPNDKLTVGQRLALHALKRDYGMDINDNSPTLSDWKVEGGAFRLSFRDVAKWYFYRPDFSPKSGFEVAGADGVFHEAWLANLVTTTNATGKVTSRGVVSGLDLVVSSPEVAQPVYLRYLADGCDFSPLHNEMDLPLGAFSVKAAVPSAGGGMGSQTTAN